MLFRKYFVVAGFIGVLFASTCFAQAKEPNKPYRLTFVVKEVEGGKVTNARTFLTRAIGGGAKNGSIRAGAKVNMMGNFIDLGASFDYSALEETADTMSLELNADISSVQRDSSSNTPVIRQNKWSSRVTLPVGKPTVVFASDDLNSKGQIQVELTVAPL